MLFCETTHTTVSQNSDFRLASVDEKCVMLSNAQLFNLLQVNPVVFGLKDICLLDSVKKKHHLRNMIDKIRILE